MKVIFLDFDGVLNGYTPFIRQVFKTAEKLHLLKLLHNVFDIFGIHFWKVFKLFCVCKITDAKVVLSSSWRRAYYKPYKECGNRGKELQRKLKFWNIPVIGMTDFIDGKREKEIQDYLEHHPEVEDFVILDDEIFDIKKSFPENFVQTSNGKIGTSDEHSGLCFSHVKKAIEILTR